MPKALLTVHEVVSVTGTTARTLHYYDRIGLLKPAVVQENGYRLYDRNNLERLQIILFLKETGVRLQDIAALLELPESERHRSLREHRELLMDKKRRLERTLDNFDRYLEAGTIFGPRPPDMPGPALREQYDREAELVYGDTPAYSGYRERMQKLERESPRDREAWLNRAERRMNAAFAGLFSLHRKKPDSRAVRLKVAEWADALGAYMDTTPELLIHIADNYRGDRRFRAFFDTFGGEAGQFASFLHAAIVQYALSLKNAKTAE
ncbi:MerR family transcriptional regulator [Saccharibacillus sp. CPCC 101409]|uniref:MerR family transcriptional regulator n=1 Tax=Saccharibacillus sp. CPCC 101409 TaxID=3058041 RepID=UPI002670FF12|nr:MerR family transcriptional regulator [Saccharibacillus sp. CPCC 101409]MDO3410781.1 MerR family transcriptional regulator [Saccharibacillus sp. CPCC 101409]